MSSLRRKFDDRTEELRDCGDMRSAAIMELMCDAIQDFISDKIAHGQPRGKLEALRKHIKSLPAASGVDAVLKADVRYVQSSPSDEGMDWVYGFVRDFWECEYVRLNAH